MRNLELKDIASHIPYDLRFCFNDGTLVKGNLKEISISNNKAYFGKHEKEESFGYDLGNFKPVLYSMDWLNKPITHKGETFVPIVELAKINEPEYTSIEINDKGRVFINTPYVENMTMVYDSINAIFLNLTIRKDGSYRLETSTAARKQQPLFDKLSEWHFDFKGLLDAGLAIPVTNEFNPYK